MRELVLLLLQPILAQSHQLVNLSNAINTVDRLAASNQSLSKAQEYSTAHYELHFVALGDWGSGDDDQKIVADAMGRKCQLGLTHHHHHHHDHHHDDQNPSLCSFVMSAGDNIYPEGVTSESDEQFDTKWKDVYTHPAIANLDWFLTLGNHDHGNHHYHDDRELHQVAYSGIEPRWKMPDLAYAFRWTSKTTNVTFVSIDTVSIDENKHDPQRILDTLDYELRRADKSDWKIVFAHYPAFSGGSYDGIHSTRHKVLPILKEHSVDLYVTGHDHNLQHWMDATGKGIDHVLVGAGGRHLYHREEDHVQRNEERGMKLHFFEDHYFGFGYFAITEDKITVQLIDAENGNVVHEFERQKQ